MLHHVKYMFYTSTTKTKLFAIIENQPYIVLDVNLKMKCLQYNISGINYSYHLVATFTCYSCTTQYKLSAIIEKQSYIILDVNLRIKYIH